MKELAQLDGLIESDILDALGENPAEEDFLDTQDFIQLEDFEKIKEPQDIVIEDFEEPQNDENILIEDHDEDSTSIESTKETCENDTKVIPQISTNEIASLLSQLLENKTIEITIKIKD